ncbi:unnamed protein product, partial [Rotaria sp. Silwood2]
YTVMDTLIRIYKSSPHTSLDHTNETDGTNTQKADEQNKGKQAKINDNDNELTRRISTVVEPSNTITTEQERDLRRHSHTGTFRRGLSIEQNETTTTITTITKTVDKKCSIKSNDTIVVLPTIPSMDVDESNDMSHRPLAPLASSETFSDVDAISRDSQQKQDNKISSINNEENHLNEESSHKTTKSDFDSLEKLFDFPSSDISSENRLDVEHSSHTTARIRFSDTNEIINSDK